MGKRKSFLGQDCYLYMFIVVMLMSLGVLISPAEVAAQGMPPAIVETSEVVEGMIAPQSRFVGTVYYQEVSDVASEVDGIVEKLHFDEGQRVSKDDILVVLNADILKKTLQSVRASYEQAVSDLEKAKRDLKRTESLFAEQLVSAQQYDNDTFNVANLQKRAASIKAEVERLEMEISKKKIRAPFSGSVLARNVDRGEWVSRGAAVATIARDDMIDILADVPGDTAEYIRPGNDVEVLVGNRNLTGMIKAIIKRGNISTRTFPVKIRIGNNSGLMEGMEAGVVLPTGPPQHSFIVPRDALIKTFGMDVVFIVNNAKAKMLPVKIVGYDGLKAGIIAEGIKTGMKVVVKGNERLRNGQPVEVVE